MAEGLRPVRPVCLFGKREGSQICGFDQRWPLLSLSAIWQSLLHSKLID